MHKIVRHAHLFINVIHVKPTLRLLMEIAVKNTAIVLINLLMNLVNVRNVQQLARHVQIDLIDAQVVKMIKSLMKSLEFVYLESLLLINVLISAQIVTIAHIVTHVKVDTSE